MGKHLCWSLFNKVAGPEACNFIKKRLYYSLFPVNFAAFLMISNFNKQLWWLLLIILDYLILHQTRTAHLCQELLDLAN